MTNKDFATKYGQFAVNVTKGTGIYPETLLAQAITESKSGESLLSKLHNNFFGIKADKSWTGQKVIMRTREVKNGQSIYIDSAFRKYASPADSFKDYVKFLQKNPRYTKAGVFKALNYNQQIEAIAAAGYATGLKYADTLKKIALNVSKSIKDFKPNTPMLGILAIAVSTYFIYKFTR